MNPNRDYFTCPEASDKAYVVVIAQRDHPEGQPWQLGIAEWEKAGYTPCPEFFATQDEGKAEAARRNAAIGLSDEDAMIISISSHRAQNLAERRR